MWPDLWNVFRANNFYYKNVWLMKWIQLLFKWYYPNLSVKTIPYHSQSTVQFSWRCWKLNPTIYRIRIHYIRKVGSISSQILEFILETKIWNWRVCILLHCIRNVDSAPPPWTARAIIHMGQADKPYLLVPKPWRKARISSVTRNDIGKLLKWDAGKLNILFFYWFLFN